MAAKHLFTRGFGNGTFTGTIALVVLRGYVPGPVGIAPCPPVPVSVGIASCPPVPVSVGLGPCPAVRAN